MSEDEWLTSPAAAEMLALLEQQMQTSRRKQQLFLCACCRLLWDDLQPPVRQAVQAVEEAVDLISYPPMPRHAASHFHDALLSAREGRLSPSDRRVVGLLHTAIYDRARCMQCDNDDPGPADWDARHAELLRELFGNPFRKVRRVGSRLHARVAAWPDNRQPDDILFVREWLSWRDRTIVDLARGVYEEGAFDRMPILADALEEAGCDEQAILEHCRGPGAHVRGCWVVDTILGRE